MRLLMWWSGRALSSAATLLGVSVLIFAAVRLMPGGFAETVLGPFATAEQKAELAARYGLDQPVFMQYGHWLGAVAGGDFGISMISRQPVGAELLARLPVTAELTVLAVAASVLLGVPLGVLTAVRARPTAAGASAGWSAAWASACRSSCWAAWSCSSSPGTRSAWRSAPGYRSPRTPPRTWPR